MDGLTVVESIAVAVILLILARRLLYLSLALLTTVSTLAVTMIGLVLCGILLLVLGLPTALISCEVLKSYDGGSYVQTGILYDICRPKPKTPKLHTSTHVPLLPPASTPGKY